MSSPSPASHRVPLRRAMGTPVAGVCAGVARHLQVSLPVTRMVFIALTVLGGVGLVLYLWLWIFVPGEQEPDGSAGRRGLSGPALDEEPQSGVPEALSALTSSPRVLAGGVLLGAAGLVSASMLGIAVDWRLIVPAIVIIIGVMLAWSRLDDAATTVGAPEDGPRSRRAALWQIGAGALLVIVSLLVIVGGLVGAGELMVGIVVAAMLLAGCALVAAPWLLKLYRTSQAERARAAAEAERADIAAHLHDSVLQTLALIYKQRHDPVQVERLARSQERQLRSYLYQEAAAVTGTLADQIRAVAADLEDTYAIAVDVVVVGESQRIDHQVLVAAAREAILNALKHAGPASVYVESDAAADAVYVRDRGEGFDPDHVPEDRLGVRESITGRLDRAGGEARIRSSERGTEVHLRMPVTARAGSASSPDVTVAPAGDADGPALSVPLTTEGNTDVR